MRVRLTVVLDRLTGNFWFIPSLMTAAAVVLAMVAIAFDHSDYGDWLRRGIWRDRLQLENARLIVSTIAGSMITVTSLVFSLTLIALTLASQQLGPRLLSVFMRDRITQVVLGLFVATFLYSLLVLAALSDVDDGWSTPVLSIVLALLLAVVSVGFLISFIHHLANSMQADTVIARMGADLARQVQRMFPERSEAPDHGADPPRESERKSEDAVEISARSSGYLQTVDLPSLVECASDRDLEIVLYHRAGDYVCEGEALASVKPRHDLGESVREDIASAFVLGRTRTPIQDLEFAMSAIVEIALRALSPGVNDPYTALTCIDQLGDTLSRVLQRGPSIGRHADADGRVRVTTPTVTLDNIMDMAFNEIRQSAKDNVSVTLRLLDTLVRLARLSRSEAAGAAIRRHSEMIERSADAHINEPRDLDDVRKRLGELDALLGDAGVG